MTRLSVAEAQHQLMELVERVDQEGEIILLSIKGRPVAKLVPAEPARQVEHLADVQGWLEDDDPFFTTIEEIVEARHQHRPRTAPEDHAL